MTEPTPRELRSAQVAHALAGAVRDGGVNPMDAARILKYELRRLNTNRSHLISVRSAGAQASIEKYAPERPPRNGSDDALHADHLYPFKPELLNGVTTLDGCIEELRRLATVVCVTARENFALEKVELAGTYGPDRYQAAGVSFVTPVPW